MSFSAHASRLTVILLPAASQQQQQRRPDDASMSFGMRFLSRGQQIVKWSGRGVVIGIQSVAVLHLVSYHLGYVRNSTGASMIPTLAPDGDILLHLRIPFYQLLLRTSQRWEKLRGGSAADETEDTSDSVWESIQLRKTRNTLRLKLGDLVVATSPANPSKQVCKRVLGLPGDTVLMDPRFKDSASVIVPRGHVFLAGDNLANSTDSRNYGTVPMGLIQGRVVARVSRLT